MNDNFYITRAAAAHMLDCDVRSLSTWQNSDIDPLPVAVKGERRGQSHRYDPQALTKWKVRQELAKVLEDGAVLDLNNERAKLAKLQAAKVQLDISERKAELVAPDELLDLFTRMIMATRSHFLAMPSRWAPMLINIKTVPEMFEQLQDAVYQALTEMADRPVQDLLKMDVPESETNE